VAARKSVVKLVTAGWKRYVSICDVDTRLVDLVREATWKEYLGSTMVGHYRHRQTWSHGTEGWKDASEDNKWM